MRLTTIASSMRQQLEATSKGFVSRALFGGLVIVYERRHQTWRLAIGREASPPSKTETEVIARDFDVPAGIEWNWATRSPKRKGRAPQWRIAECTWIEQETSHASDSDCE